MAGWRHPAKSGSAGRTHDGRLPPDSSGPQCPVQGLDCAADCGGPGRAPGIDADVSLDVLQHLEGAGVETAGNTERRGVLAIDYGVGSLVGHGGGLPGCGAECDPEVMVHVAA